MLFLRHFSFACIAHVKESDIKLRKSLLTSVNFSLFCSGKVRKYLIHPLSLSLTRMPYLRNVTIDQSTLSFAEMRFVLPLILVLLGLLRVDSFGLFR